MSDSVSFFASTTGIGSLPHPYVDAALDFSFRFDIPFLPQLPVRSPKEYMLYQALEQLPGLVDADNGLVAVNREAWELGKDDLRARTEAAFESGDDNAFAFFEPGRETHAAWQPFLFELSERKKNWAKVQMAGPLTCQWVLRFSDGAPTISNPSISTQVLRLILARSISMVRRVREFSRPIFFLDEPGLFGLSGDNPKHVLALKELALFIRTLKNEGAKVGLHCCSNTRWDLLLSLPLDILSFDASLSLREVLSHRASVEAFIGRGGIFSFGVIPTGDHRVKLYTVSETKLVDVLRDTLCSDLGWSEARSVDFMEGCLYSPACGLALHSVQDAEHISDLTLAAGHYIASLSTVPHTQA